MDARSDSSSDFEHGINDFLDTSDDDGDGGVEGGGIEFGYHEWKSNLKNKRGFNIALDCQEEYVLSPLFFVNFFLVHFCDHYL